MNVMMCKAFSRLAVTISLFMVSSAALAVDVKGDYVVRGMGAHSCSDFVARVPSNPAYTQASLVWMEGYLTAQNRLTAKTFDASFLNETSEVAALVLNACKSRADIRVESILAGIIAALHTSRVETNSPLIEFKDADVKVLLRQSTVKHLQMALKKSGFYTLGIDGLSGPGTMKALRKYQKARGLKVSGLPDADTLIKLFITEQQVAKK